MMKVSSILIKVKFVIFFVVSLIMSSCKAQINIDKFNTTSDSIFVEKFAKDITDENKYNFDNTIYVQKRAFTYSYYYLGLDGKRYLIKKGKESLQGNFKTLDWEFVEEHKQDVEAVKKIVLSAELGNPFKDDDPNYYQTAISYEYVLENGKSFAREITGAIENKMNVWIHPPRSKFFRILEINPFPYIKAPFKIGNKWRWNLTIGDSWSDKRWLTWKGKVENHYQYEIIGKEDIKIKIGNIACYVVKASGKSEIGKTELLAYFNNEYGFVKLDYTNIDGTKTIIELIKVE